MKIRMLGSIAGRDELPGQVVEQPESTAHAWIQSGLAEAAEPEHVAEPAVTPAATSEEPVASEPTAPASESRPRRRREP